MSPSEQAARRVARDAVHTLIDVVGTGYHPDGSLDSYVTLDGKPSFSDDEVKYLTCLQRFAWKVLDGDIYDVGLNHPSFVELKFPKDLKITHSEDMQHGDRTVRVWQNTIGNWFCRGLPSDGIDGCGKTLAAALENFDHQMYEHGEP